MNYKEKVVELLEKNMTEKGFKLWIGINNILPDIWDKPTASTLKYHKKLNGEVPCNAEHTYQMLYCVPKLIRMFDLKPKTSDADTIFFAIALHDSLKYGKFGSRIHTDTMHDKKAADVICENKDIFLKILTEEQFQVLEEGIRFHAGRWSTDVSKHEPFSFKNYNKETLMIHILDMLSTADLIQTDIRE